MFSGSKNSSWHIKICSKDVRSGVKNLELFQRFFNFSKNVKIGSKNMRIHSSMTIIDSRRIKIEV